MKRYNLAAGDFPDIDDFRSKLQEMDFSKFHSVKVRLLEDVEQALTIDIPRLLEALPRSRVHQAQPTATGPLVYESAAAAGDWATGEDEDSNPFNDGLKGADADWILTPHVDRYRTQFDAAANSAGFMPGAAAKNILLGTNIPKTALRRVWDLCDIDKDGQLDLLEFVLAMYLVEQVQLGKELPLSLSHEMIPPSKK